MLERASKAHSSRVSDHKLWLENNGSVEGDRECAGDPHNSISRPFKGRFAFLAKEWLRVLRYLVCQLLQDCFKLMTPCSVKM